MVFRQKEREAQSFYSGFFICALSRATPAQGLHEQAKVNASRPVSILNSTNFLQIAQIFRALPVHDVIRTCYPRLPSRAIVTSLSDSICSVRAHAGTPALMLHLSNLCTEQKGSQPN